jgi:hypothetical protein
MMVRPAANMEAPIGTANRGPVGFEAARVSELLASEPVTQGLDESSLAVLVKFFQLLDRWHREASSRC